jgi:hypothetical protein
MLQGRPSAEWQHLQVSGLLLWFGCTPLHQQMHAAGGRLDRRPT